VSKYKAIVVEADEIETDLLGEPCTYVDIGFTNYGHQVLGRDGGKVLVQVYVDGDSEQQSVAQGVIDGYGVEVPAVAGEE